MVARILFISAGSWNVLLSREPTPFNGFKCIGSTIFYTSMQSFINNNRERSKKEIKPMDQNAPQEDREETLFLKAFGIKSPVLRILDFLMDNKAYDYSKTDIAKGSGISRTTLFSVWDNLEKNSLVRETRSVGRAKMYKLNLKNPVVLKFIELDNTICDQYASQLAKQEAIADPQKKEPNRRLVLA
jgi:DNA-binding MarR family transcriptional regulator